MNIDYSTSPSIYLQILGTAAVSDQCTTVGPVLTDPIITLAPNQVSTWKPDNKDNQWLGAYYNFTVGEIWGDPAGVPGYDYVDGIAPLDIKDLACPTWGLEEVQLLMEPLLPLLARHGFH